MNKIVFWTCVFLLVACSNSDDTTIPKEVDGSLLGKWTWVRSTGSIAGVTITPENTGKVMTIEFDGENFEKFIDGERVYYSPYVLKDENDAVKIQYTTLALFIAQGLGFDHSVEQTIRFFEGDKLLMVDPCCDNFTFEFVKQ